MIQYVEMDVHKEAIDVGVYRENERKVFLERTIRNQDVVIKKLFKELLERGGVVVCYEAGCMGFGLQRMLEGLGLASIVVSPGRVPRGAVERIKTEFTP